MSTLSTLDKSRWAFPRPEVQGNHKYDVYTEPNGILNGCASSATSWWRIDIFQFRRSGLRPTTAWRTTCKAQALSFPLLQQIHARGFSTVNPRRSPSPKGPTRWSASLPPGYERSSNGQWFNCQRLWLAGDDRATDGVQDMHLLHCIFGAIAGRSSRGEAA